MSFSEGKWERFPGTAQHISVGQAGVFIVDGNNQMQKKNDGNNQMQEKNDGNNQMQEKKGESWTVVQSGEDIADISVGQQTVWVVMKNNTIFRRKSSWEKLPGSLTNVSTLLYYRLVPSKSTTDTFCQAQFQLAVQCQSN